MKSNRFIRWCGLNWTYNICAPQKCINITQSNQWKLPQIQTPQNVSWLCPWLFRLSRLPCSFITYAVLGSYLVQSELGDHATDEMGFGASYIRHLQFAPNQTEELMEKVAELHRTHRWLVFRGSDFVQLRYFTGIVGSDHITYRRWQCFC